MCSESLIGSAIFIKSERTCIFLFMNNSKNSNAAFDLHLMRTFSKTAWVERVHVAVRKKMATWTRQETLKLIEIWGRENIQAQLEVCKRNQKVFQTIAREIQSEGYDRSYQQCREKVKKLKKEYKKIKDKLNKTGVSGRKRLTSWDFFDPLDSILGHKPATHPPVVLDSLEEIAGGNESNSEGVLDSMGDETDSRGSSRVVSCETSSEPMCSPKVKAEGCAPVMQKKKWKRQFEMLQESMKDMVQLAAEAQKASNKMFLELEEKRMRMEEEQQEREMQMRREEQEF